MATFDLQEALRERRGRQNWVRGGNALIEVLGYVSVREAAEDEEILRMHVTDLLVDLMHGAERTRFKIDFVALAEEARLIYEAERDAAPPLPEESEDL